MSKDEILKYIEAIDEELKKNEDVINSHSSADVMILHTTSKLLRDARKMWIDVLEHGYGVFYV